MIKKVAFAFLACIFSIFASDIETISKTQGVLTAKTLSQFKNLFDLHSFIETGTYGGDTTAEAAKIFKEVHSIEIWEPLFRRAQKRFIYSPNVNLYLGDTTTQLVRMIENSGGKRLYWLDAHSSGEGTGGVPGFSPILPELEQILGGKKDFDSVILIDDLRGMYHTDKRSNVPLREIIQKINNINPDLQFYSIGDIGIIFNTQKYHSISISEIVKKASFSRFFDPACEDEEMLEKLIDAESFIASIPENTTEEKNFAQLIKWVNRNNLGGEVSYLFWESLRELEKKDLASAIRDLQLVANSFYSHWRINAYLVKALLLDGQLDKASSLFNEKLLHWYAKHPRIMKKIVNVDLIRSPE